MLRDVKIGSPLAEGVFMGPLVSQAAHAKLVRYRALASEAGGERLLAVDPGLPAPFAAVAHPLRQEGIRRNGPPGAPRRGNARP